MPRRLYEPSRLVCPYERSQSGGPFCRRNWLRLSHICVPSLKSQSPRIPFLRVGSPDDIRLASNAIDPSPFENGQAFHRSGD